VDLKFRYAKKGDNDEKKTRSIKNLEEKYRKSYFRCPLFEVSKRRKATKTATFTFKRVI
jgi:hypothetical protein